MNFLVVSYKPNSDDYCRGCHMASYSSAFEQNIYKTEDEVVEHIAKLDAEELDCGEEGYEHTIYVWDAENKEITELYETDIYSRADAEAKARIENREAAKKAEKIAKQAAAQAKKEQEERDELERLKAKYESTG